MAYRVSDSATVTSVALTATSSTPAALASGAGRNFRAISNISGQIVYARFGGGTASATDHTVAIAAGAYYEFPQPLFGGAIALVMASGSGNVLVTTY